MISRILSVALVVLSIIALSRDLDSVRGWACMILAYALDNRAAIEELKEDR